MDKKASIFFSLNDRACGYRNRTNLQRNALGSEFLIKRLLCERSFVGHNGCVNTVTWNDTGDILLSGSDDCKLNIYKMSSSKKGLRSKRRILFFAKYCESGYGLQSRLKCGANGSKDLTCSGYLVKWLPPDTGLGQSLRNAIRYNTVPTLVERVRGFQLEQQARLKTGDDLEKIRKFMVPPDAVKRGYNRICDLQGFFMKTGGFTIADPEGVELYTPITDTCYDNTYPTTQKVLKGLEDMETGITK